MSIERELARLRVPAPAHLADGVALGLGLVDGYGVFDSPIGAVVVAFNPGGISMVDLADDRFERRFGDLTGRRLVEARPPAAWGSRIARAIERGTPGRLPLDLRSVTPFRREVLLQATTIPRGEVRPYGWLAGRIGRPRATRAVGSAMASNPVPLIVPCHRVVRSDGRIGDYSLGGPGNKRRLLEAEGLEPTHLEDLAARHVRYLGSTSTGVYCLPTCRHARRITARHLVELHSPAEADSLGLRPCAVCRP
jgi:O-6-methylguanine DNA methyltransferase